MPADKLGRYMQSAEFLQHAKVAIAQACRALEAKGITPVFIRRDIGITVPDAEAQAVLNDLLKWSTADELRQRIVEVAKTPGGPARVAQAVRAVASALLLAKTAMPHENGFTQAVTRQLASVSEHPALAELGLLMAEAEEAATNDVFRDPTLISDELFARRIEMIRQVLRK